MSNSVIEKEFVSDIYHSIVLNNYISYWGMPKERVISRRIGFNEKIYVYYFPCNEQNAITRIATIGLSLQSKSCGKVGCEYILTLPCNLGSSPLIEIFNYLLDISANTVVNIDDVTPPRISGSNNLAPKAWKTKAILFDELRGESEKFSLIPYNELFKTQFIWVIPIYESEYEAIKKNGIEFFDNLEQLSEISIVDVTRAPFC